VGLLAVPCAAAECPAARALAVVVEGVSPSLQARVERELSVEAARLGLELCTPVGVARVTATLALQGAVVRLGARDDAGRLVGRDVPLADESEGAALELALVLGELVREVMTPRLAAAPVAQRAAWRVGARGAIDVFGAGGAVLLGGDVVARVLPGPIGVELFVSGRDALTRQVAQGSASLAGLGGGVALQAGPWRVGPLGLGALAGVTALAVHAQGSSATAVTGAGWAPLVDARVGVALEVRAGPVVFSLTGGALAVLAGVSLTADGVEVLGARGVGGFATLGLSLTTEGR
jgi:hypothetical protein